MESKMPTEKERQEYGQKMWNETSQSTRDALREDLKRFTEKWDTSEEAVLNLLAQVGRQNGIRAVCSELPA